MARVLLTEEQKVNSRVDDLYAYVKGSCKGRMKMKDLAKELNTSAPNLTYKLIHGKINYPDLIIIFDRLNTPDDERLRLTRI